MFFVLVKNEKPYSVVTEDHANDYFDTIGEALASGEADQVRSFGTIEDMTKFMTNCVKSSDKVVQQSTDSQNLEEFVESLWNGVLKGAETVFTEVAKDATVKKAMESFESIFKSKRSSTLD